MTKFTFIPKSVRYFINLHLERTLKNLQYIYRNEALVYAFRCQVDNMVYCGSTLIPARRFHNHIATGEYSNKALQQAISEHGLEKFTLNILEIVVFPTGLTLDEKKVFLRTVEQKHMDKFPKAQLYNSIKAKS